MQPIPGVAGLSVTLPKPRHSLVQLQGIRHHGGPAGEDIDCGACTLPLLAAAIGTIGLRVQRDKRFCRKFSKTARRTHGSDSSVEVILRQGDIEVKPLALQRGDAIGEDELIASCRGPGLEGWKRLRLKRSDGDCWVGVGAELPELQLNINDHDLANRLLPAKAIDADLAPGWPKNLMDSLHPWPLKGRGTIAFDAMYFLEQCYDLAAAGKGPLMLPGGAARLNLPTAVTQQALQDALSKHDSKCGLMRLLSKSDSGIAAQELQDVSYGELLTSSEAVRSGFVDLSRCRKIAGSRREVCLPEEIDCDIVPRLWAHGAVFRDISPAEVAEAAGCLRGDVIISINGHEISDMPLGNINALIPQLEQPFKLVVEQPVLEGHFYIHAASPALLNDVAGSDAAAAADTVVPALQKLLNQHAGGDYVPALKQKRAGTWAGDGGTASRLHKDNEHRIEFCHVLHGVKIFVVETDGGAAASAVASKELGAKAEVALTSDQALPSSLGTWLAGSGVSVAACGPGDMMCFWGGDLHGGTNAMNAGPCIAFFHG